MDYNEDKSYKSHKLISAAKVGLTLLVIKLMLSQIIKLQLVQLIITVSD